MEKVSSKLINTIFIVKSKIKKQTKLNAQPIFYFFNSRLGNIDWDTDGDKELKASLPQEMDVPDNMSLDEISDYISDKVGFCHNGFILQTQKNFNKK